jgi:hypothetical protein
MALGGIGKKKSLAAAGVFAALIAGGMAFADSGHSAAATPFRLAADIRGFGVDYATTGASQVRADSGNGSDCSANNLASSSASLSVPSGSKVLRAMLYWVGLEKHESRGHPNVVEISDVAQLTLPSGARVAVDGDRRLEATGTFNGGTVQYAGYQADITRDLAGSIDGNYTVAIRGGIPELCAYSGENARAWQLVVVYDTPSPEYSIVYLYDGLNFLSHSATPITIGGFNAEAGRPSTLTAFVVQGDSNLAGEYANVSDATFGDFPNNFANETVNGSATGANGQAIDIDTITGDLVPGSKTLTIDYGTTQDVILPVTFALRLASVPPSPPPTTVPTTVPGSLTTVPGSPTTVAGSPTTVAGSPTTIPATLITDPATPTTVAPDPTTTAVVIAVTVTAAPTTTTTTTVPQMAIT